MQRLGISSTAKTSSGLGPQLVKPDAGHQFDQPHLTRLKGENRQFSNQQIDSRGSRQRQRTLRHNLRLAIPITMLHRDDQLLRTAGQIHRPAHAQQRLAGGSPIRQITVLIHLQAAHHRHIDMAAADHGEGVGAVEIAAAG